MKKAGQVDYWISPDGSASLVYVEPKCWDALLHKDKIAFIQMFIIFFLDYNLKHSGPDQIPFFSVLNISTHARLVRCWLLPSRFGEIEIFQKMFIQFKRTF